MDTCTIICICECASCSNFLAFRVWTSLLGGRPGASDPEYSLTGVHLSIKCFSQATSLQRLLLYSFINSEIWRYVTGSSFVGFVFRNTEGWRDDRFFDSYGINEIIDNGVSRKWNPEATENEFRAHDYPTIWNIQVFEIQTMSNLFISIKSNNIR